ncbi:MAG TPA: glycosyltransferase family 4 protein [Gemmatimonadaceae bacterium]|nr:glycosyltransferase family 4 protein [Gemmatimonadaceae bacterium]
MTRRIVVLHVAAPSRVGGLERVVADLSSRQAANGTNVHVVGVFDNAGDAAFFCQPLSANGVRAHAIVLPRRAYVRERSALRSFYRSIAPDVVHTHGYHSDVIASRLARRLNIPTVATVHGFTGGGWRNRLYERLQVRALRSVDTVVAVSRPLGELLRRRGVARARIRVIQNAWASRRGPYPRTAARLLLGIQHDAFCVGWVGRLSHEKGADVLVDAVVHLPTDIVVSIIGGGREREALEIRAQKLGVASRIRWHGALDDAAQLMGAFDVVALSSRTEGTPMVLFEAIAAGVPVIATNVGGIPDVITDETGTIVPPEDSLALASAIARVRNDPGAASDFASAALRALSTRFAPEPWVASYDQVYDQLLKATKARDA